MTEEIPPNAPYYVRLKRLREDAGLTQMRFRDRILQLWQEGKVTLPRNRRGPDRDPDPYESIKRNEMVPKEGDANGSERYPSAQMLAAYAIALGVEPDVFPEHRLAMARRLLDEREVGLDQALANLQASALVPPFSAADAETPTLPRAKPVPDPDETTPAQTGPPARTADAASDAAAGTRPRRAASRRQR